MNNLSKVITVKFFVSFIMILMILVRVLYTGSIKNVFLVWNLFLAWFPFLISLFIVSINNGYQGGFKRFILMLSGIMWLLFLPNAPYMITDYIHLNVYNYYIPDSAYYQFNSDYIIWYDLILISLFAWLAYFLGFLSIYILQKIIMVKYHIHLSWLFVFLVSLLTGFGIFLGRFFRLNSWDLLFSPIDLLSELLLILDTKSIILSSFFALFIFLIYVILYFMSFLGEEAN